METHCARNIVHVRYNYTRSRNISYVDRGGDCTLAEMTQLTRWATLVMLHCKTSKCRFSRDLKIRLCKWGCERQQTSITIWCGRSENTFSFCTQPLPPALDLLNSSSERSSGKGGNFGFSLDCCPGPSVEGWGTSTGPLNNVERARDSFMVEVVCWAALALETANIPMLAACFISTFFWWSCLIRWCRFFTYSIESSTMVDLSRWNWSRYVLKCKILHQDTKHSR